MIKVVEGNTNIFVFSVYLAYYTNFLITQLTPGNIILFLSPS